MIYNGPTSSWWCDDCDSECNIKSHERLAKDDNICFEWALSVNKIKREITTPAHPHTLPYLTLKWPWCHLRTMQIKAQRVCSFIMLCLMVWGIFLCGEFGQKRLKKCMVLTRNYLQMAVGTPIIMKQWIWPSYRDIGSSDKYWSGKHIALTSYNNRRTHRKTDKRMKGNSPKWWGKIR